MYYPRFLKKLKGQPVLYRHYRIAFADPAYVLWRQHFPCDLMTGKSVKDLFEAHRLTYPQPQLLLHSQHMMRQPLSLQSLCRYRRLRS